MVASTKSTQELHSKYGDVFLGIWCFKDTFSLQVEEGVKPYQAYLGTWHTLYKSHFKKN